MQQQRREERYVDAEKAADKVLPVRHLPALPVRHAQHVATQDKEQLDRLVA